MRSGEMGRRGGGVGRREAVGGGLTFSNQT